MISISELLTCQHGQSRGLSGSVVSQQHRDLSLEHVQRQIPHGLPRLVAQFEFLHKTSLLI